MSKPISEFTPPKAQMKPAFYVTKPTRITAVFADIPSVANVAICLDQPQDAENYSQEPQEPLRDKAAHSRVVTSCLLVCHSANQRFLVTNSLVIHLFVWLRGQEPVGGASDHG